MELSVDFSLVWIITWTFFIAAGCLGAVYVKKASRSLVPHQKFERISLIPCTAAGRRVRQISYIRRKCPVKESCGEEELPSFLKEATTFADLRKGDR